MAVAFDPMAIAADLAQCVQQALTAEDRGEDVWAGEVCVLPGSQVAWDTCCEDKGQAWVVLKNGYPTSSFPAMDSSTPTTTCTDGVVSLGLNFEIGVLRCVCSSECTCDIHETEASRIFGDLSSVFQALNCCFTATDDDCDGTGWRLNGFDLVGPQGGCAGVTVNIAVNTRYPCCPPPTP